MNNFSRLDGFYGSMLAAESIKDGMTVLHGPEGCRAYASNVSTRYVKRPLETREGDFFFHRSRIPCSCIDGDDYIYGSSEKVSMILDILRRNSTVFATVLESPGASLIGDRLADEVAAAGMDGHVAVLGKCFMSETFGYGYDRTLELIARKLVKKIPADDDAVRMAAKISMNYNMEGHRADITLIRAARANAALEGRDRITKEDMEAVAALVLAHRVKKRAFDKSGFDEAGVRKCLASM